MAAIVTRARPLVGPLVTNFRGGIDWLMDAGVRVVDLHSAECVRLLREYIATHADVWNEDIGR